MNIEIMWMNIKFYFINLSFKLKRCWYIMFEDQQFDYQFILNNELLKLEHTVWYYKFICTHIYTEEIVSDLEECISLLKQYSTIDDCDQATEILNNYHDLRKKRIEYWWD